MHLGQKLLESAQPVPGTGPTSFSLPPDRRADLWVPLSADSVVSRGGYRAGSAWLDSTRVGSLR
jgi:hypothetical protein